MSILATDDQYVDHRFWPRVWRWIAVFVVAMTVAAPAAGFGAWLGWRGAASLPTDQRAREIAAAVVPGMTVGEVERHDMVFGSYYPTGCEAFAGAEEYDAGSVSVVKAGAVPVMDLAGARAALRRDGWQLRPDQEPGSVTARRDGIQIAVHQGPGPGGVVFHRVEPALVRVLALVGWGAGLLLGGWIGLRFSRRSRPAAARVLGGIGTVLLLVPTIAVTGGLLLPGPAPIPPDGPDALWEPYVAWPFTFFVLVALCCWAVAGVLRWSPRAARFTREWTRFLFG
ncbi:hypothetical protein [Actinoplanes sp. NPDC020271]|uniref:hypothetical protein n=1 Tax=Actinoplanes sp. NPDC020271 TaxID=3363896 RepID=UPI0037B142A3